MENASKALLITGAILVGIVAITLGMYLFRGARGFSQNYEDEQAIQRKIKFNAQFEVYIAREDLTIHDIITVYNLAKEIGSVSVYLEGNLINHNMNKQEQQEMIKKELADTSGNIKVYKCNAVDYDADTGRVNKIKFVNI